MKIFCSEGIEMLTFIHYVGIKVLESNLPISKNFKGINLSTQKFCFRNLASSYAQNLQKAFIEILFVTV